VRAFTSARSTPSVGPRGERFRAVAIAGRRVWLVAAAAAVLASSLGAVLAIVLSDHKASVPSPLTGGKLVSYLTFPSLAEIYYLPHKPGYEGGAQCTGTVVSPRLVLTAGHCVEAPGRQLRSARDFEVFTGDATSPPRSEPLPVLRAIVFPGFTRELDDSGRDAALLVLRTRTPAPPVALPVGSDRRLSSAGSRVRIVAWATMPSEQFVASQEREAVTEVRLPTTCRAEPLALAPLCTHGTHAHQVSICTGDSGGPLLAISHSSDLLVQIGVASSGRSPKGAALCSPEAVNFWASTQSIAPWLAKWIRLYSR
jgi:secreted trypsin-like serine protease